MTAFNLNGLLNNLSLETVTLRLGLQHMNLKRGRVDTIQSIASSQRALGSPGFGARQAYL